MALDVTVTTWLAEALARGFDVDTIVRACPFPKVSERALRRELRALERSPHHDVIATLAFRLQRLEWQAAARRTFAGLSRAPRGIPVITPSGKRDVIENYYAPQRPVVLRGAMNDWKALTRWTPAFFIERFGDVRVSVAAGRDETALYDLNVHAISRDTSFGDYVRWVESTRSSNANYLVANNNGLGGPLRALVKDIGFFGGLMNRRRIDGFVYLWYGPRGTVTPLHHDTSNILFCQVRGKKRVTLIDPVWTELVRDCVSFYSLIDVEKPDAKRFPYFAKVPKLTVTLGPGDALLLPCGWWHFVRSLSTSVSVSMTNFSVPNPGGFNDVMPGTIDD